jgi:hypothetical protein
MTARQEHGFTFEHWVRDTFTTNEKGRQDAEWDIENPDYREEYKIQTQMYSGLPVSIKVRQYGEPIQFGDVTRQYNVEKDFVLIVGIWRATEGGKKRFINVSVMRIINQEWKKLFAEIIPPDGSGKTPMTTQQVGEKLSNYVKFVKENKFIKGDRVSLTKAREEATFMKKGMPKTTMGINQKIDDEQRRVQCSLRFKIFMSRFANMEQHVKEGDEIKAALWGVPVPDLD